MQKQKPKHEEEFILWKEHHEVFTQSENHRLVSCKRNLGTKNKAIRKEHSHIDKRRTIADYSFPEIETTDHENLATIISTKKIQKHLLRIDVYGETNLRTIKTK